MTSTLTETLVLEPAAQDLLFRDARTVAAFTDEPVGDDLLHAVYDLVRAAPTSMNCCPLRVLALRSESARARLLLHMAEGNREKTAAAPLVLVLAADHAFTEHMPTLFPFVDADAYFADPALRAGTAEYNAALQAGYLILGLRAAGLGVGPMAGFDREGVDAEFFPEGRLHTALVLIAGRPAGESPYPRLPRPDFDQVVTSL
ncbi:malonic semialdehyde reductase [Pseudonocardia halophobica]|uniref:NADH dehydrogenase/NAD(P)H nitroreductase n=1 Tax=Pseudonocardia halophobica TaxID=29401 RepID=A0A9W6NXF4_9PSEU|nr:malonic semialdehyde reductase [Pseudonocardia halophobica]GLL12673.1 putative NADH dehydrogenase/NAD(P)H nitroreductase [Pseudonocardia halophobica]